MKLYAKVLIASFLVIFACLGFGRFAFGMILPDMQANLAISTTQAGFIGTANFIGYLVGILFASSLYSKIETTKLISVSLILQGISMLAMIFYSNYIFISFFYTIAGFFGAVANIAIMVYISHIIPQNIRGKALGIVVSGNGLAIIISGMMVPFINGFFGDISWKISWGFFAFITILIAFFARPGLQAEYTPVQSIRKNSPKELYTNSNFWKITSLYIIFGITYVVYVTFFVSAAIDKWHVSIYLSGIFWAVLGFMSIFSGPIFGILADKFGAFKILILVFVLQSFANIILTLDINVWALWISVSLFGLSVWCIPSLITLLCSQYFSPEKTAFVFSQVTLVFAVGQILAPVTAGYIYDMTLDFSNVFLVTSILTISAILLSFIYARKELINS